MKRYQICAVMVSALGHPALLPDAAKQTFAATEVVLSASIWPGSALPTISIPSVTVTMPA